MTKIPLCLLALALAGCTMIPKYERPAAPVAPNFPGNVATQAAPEASELAWRDFFSEERLTDLIGLALTNNRDMRIAALNVEQSQAAYRITRSALLPTVNGAGAYNRSRVLGVFPDSKGNLSASYFTTYNWSAGLGTTAYEVDFFGRVRSLNRQALEKYFATAEARRSAQISLVAAVADQYFAEREAQEQLELARRTLDTVQHGYDLNKSMFDAGASSELDVRTAEGQVETAKINLVTYERALAQAENYLTLLVGEPLPDGLPTPRPFWDTNLLTEVHAGLPSELALRRPDILAAEHTLLAANADIGAARAAFFPTVTLTGSVGTSSLEFSKLFKGAAGVWSFAPQVTVPIFTGGQNRAQLDAAKLGKLIEVAAYERAIQTAFREVADALAANETYARQMREQAALTATQQRRFDLADARYRQGEDTYLNVLSAQVDLYRSQQDLLQTQFDKLASQISLYRALGGGWK